MNFYHEIFTTTKMVRANLLNLNKLAILNQIRWF